MFPYFSADYFSSGAASDPAQFPIRPSRHKYTTAAMEGKASRGAELLGQGTQDAKPGPALQSSALGQQSEAEVGNSEQTAFWG